MVVFFFISIFLFFILFFLGPNFVSQEIPIRNESYGNKLLQITNIQFKSKKIYLKKENFQYKIFEKKHNNYLPFCFVFKYCCVNKFVKNIYKLTKNNFFGFLQPLFNFFYIFTQKYTQKSALNFTLVCVTFL